MHRFAAKIFEQSLQIINVLGHGIILRFKNVGIRPMKSSAIGYGLKEIPKDRYLVVPRSVIARGAVDKDENPSITILDIVEFIVDWIRLKHGIFHSIVLFK